MKTETLIDHTGIADPLPAPNKAQHSPLPAPIDDHASALVRIVELKTHADKLAEALRKCLASWANENALTYETVEDSNAAISAYEAAQ